MLPAEFCLFLAGLLILVSNEQLKMTGDEPEPDLWKIKTLHVLEAFAQGS